MRRIGSQTRAGLGQTGTGYWFQFAAAHARVAEMGGRGVAILHFWRLTRHVSHRMCGLCQLRPPFVFGTHRSQLFDFSTFRYEFGTAATMGVSLVVFLTAFPDADVVDRF